VYVSAWWGQYESIYVLAALIAYLLAISGRPTLATVALAISVMTKPQALPFIVPFAAWFLARQGVERCLKLAAVFLLTLAVLWLPFVPAGGPVAYLSNLGQYQGDIFAVLSLRAWNPWWLVQEAYGKQEFISDSVPIVGPITLRLVGYVVTALLEAVVFLAVWRSPSRRSLALGLATATLLAFIGLTSMHERYAYAAVVFLALLPPSRAPLALWVAVGFIETLNLVAAAPPFPEIARALPIFGLVGIVGSFAISLLAVYALMILVRRSQASEFATGSSAVRPQPG
jgi:Gpi18-like mannosyltransferase